MAPAAALPAAAPSLHCYFPGLPEEVSMDEVVKPPVKPSTAFLDALLVSKTVSSEVALQVLVAVVPAGIVLLLLSSVVAVGGGCKGR